MRLKVLVGILVFLIILNLATIGTFLYVHFSRDAGKPPEALSMRRVAGPGRARGFGDRPMRFHHEEREALRTLLDEFRNETEDLRSRVRDLERETFELMHRDSVPMTEVDSLLKEISRLQYDVSKAAAMKLIEAKNVLPHDQQEQFFNALHHSHSIMRGDARHRGAGRSPGRWHDRQGRDTTTSPKTP